MLRSASTGRVNDFQQRLDKLKTGMAASHERLNLVAGNYLREADEMQAQHIAAAHNEIKRSPLTETASDGV